MKRTEITDILARKYKAMHPEKPLSRDILSEVVNIFIEIIQESLIDYGEFAISNLFRIYVYQSKRTKGYDMVNCKPITFEPCKSLKIKTMERMREMLNITDAKTN